jgi:hypothetical protein
MAIYFSESAVASLVHVYGVLDARNIYITDTNLKI